MNWNLEGLCVKGLYMGEYRVSGKVTLSRIACGQVLHFISLDKPLNILGGAVQRDSGERVIVEHKYITQVSSR
jgi:hypothetical protein